MSSVYAVLLALVACVLVFEIVSALRRVSRPLQGLELRVEPMALSEERRGQSLPYIGQDRRQAASAAAEDRELTAESMREAA